MTTSPQGTNFRQSELDKFAELANRWWDADGPQKPLHALNPVRLDFVAARRPLAGARVLDVGCGGGLLSEAMARAGAEARTSDQAEPEPQVHVVGDDWPEEQSQSPLDEIGLLPEQQQQQHQQQSRGGGTPC